MSKILRDSPPPPPSVDPIGFHTLVHKTNDVEIERLLIRVLPDALFIAIS